ncbi:MAG: K(+)-transporting ATPase subunit F [Cyanobacteria bacterium]|nr:K(+)-transporting ATPase subunit F [Cyanobacteriota bacterium]
MLHLMLLIAAVLAVLLMIYLVIALLKPEIFA